jgi:putative acetyltransferase
MRVRREVPEDRGAVAEVHRQAFGDHSRVVVPLVEDLRQSLRDEQGLSLVAVDRDGHVIAHVLFTRSLLDAPRGLVDVQVLSPVAVRPNRQRQGIGGALIQAGLRELDSCGVPLVFLEGSPGYYGRHGFVRATDYNFRRPSLRIPVDAFQVKLLSSHRSWMTGTLVYRQTFWDHDAVGLRDD